MLYLSPREPRQRGRALVSNLRARGEERESLGNDRRTAVLAAGRAGHAAQARPAAHSCTTRAAAARDLASQPPPDHFGRFMENDSRTTVKSMYPSLATGRALEISTRPALRMASSMCTPTTWPMTTIASGAGPSSVAGMSTCVTLHSNAAYASLTRGAPTKWQGASFRPA